MVSLLWTSAVRVELILRRSQEDVSLARYVAEALSTLEFKRLEEPMMIISYLNSALAVAGLQVLHLLEMGTEGGGGILGGTPTSSPTKTSRSRSQSGSPVKRSNSVRLALLCSSRARLTLSHSLSQIAQVDEAGEDGAASTLTSSYPHVALADAAPSQPRSNRPPSRSLANRSSAASPCSSEITSSSSTPSRTYLTRIFQRAHADRLLASQTATPSSASTSSARSRRREIVYGFCSSLAVINADYFLHRPLLVVPMRLSRSGRTRTRGCPSSSRR